MRRRYVACPVALLGAARLFAATFVFDDAVEGYAGQVTDTLSVSGIVMTVTAALESGSGYSNALLAAPPATVDPVEVPENQQFRVETFERESAGGALTLRWRSAPGYSFGIEGSSGSVNVGSLCARHHVPGRADVAFLQGSGGG